MNTTVEAVTTCAVALMAAAAVAAPPIQIGNAALSLSFDRATGALIGLRNLSSNDEYLKTPAGAGNLFLIHTDPTIVPQAARDPGWWSGTVEESLGGPVVTPAQCRVLSARRSRSGAAETLIVEARHEATGLRARLTIKVPNAGDYADLALRITNEGTSATTMVTAFPHLSGLCLGPKRDTNLGIMMASYGTPGVKAWVNSGGWYGRETSMQWQAAYEPAMDEGVGLIVMDPATLPKLIRRGPGGVLSALYYPGQVLAPGESHTYPTARLVVHRGSWRVTAGRYRDWFYGDFKARKPPAWLAGVDLYSGNWIPTADAVAKAKREDPAQGFTSYERMPLLYRDGPYDLIEWAMYNQGVQDHPETYGPYMGDGTYCFRSDLGGATAMREGVRRLHAMGRRIMFYVAGNSILRTSDVLKGTRFDDWMLMDRPGHGYDVGYPNGFSVCPGYGPWQDHLARTARRMLSETGADGIRLDELASFVPCFNPAHRHSHPYDSVRWLRELTRKVRAAMDEVNPDAILLTEGPLDALHESCNGALQMFQPGREIDAMRVAVPTLVGMAYHPGAVESALNGWIGGKVTARRVTWPWEHRGLSGKPSWYADGPGPDLRWHELRASFGEAAIAGLPGLVDPVAVRQPGWAGRIWKGSRYWLVVGGTLDAVPLSGGETVRVPGLPQGVVRAVEINAQTLEVRDARLNRVRGIAHVTVTAPFGVVVLPLPTCPPLVSTGRERPQAAAGQEVRIALEPIPLGRPGRGKLTVTCPGLITGTLTVPVSGIMRFAVPAGAEPGLYPLRIEGDCLPAKRWLRVTQ